MTNNNNSNNGNSNDKAGERRTSPIQRATVVQTALDVWADSRLPHSRRCKEAHRAEGVLREPSKASNLANTCNVSRGSQRGCDWSATRTELQGILRSSGEEESWEGVCMHCVGRWWGAAALQLWTRGRVGWRRPRRNAAGREKLGLHRAARIVSWGRRGAK